MNIIEKILARHSGLARVAPGDIVTCDVDKAVQLDIVFMGQGKMVPLRIDHPERVVVLMDHYVPAPSIAAAKGQAIAREFVKKFGIRKFYDIGNHGICHQLFLEKGIALPGQILACTDSHTIASGAINCAARGLGPIEVLQIVCTGKTWYKVAPTIQVILEGELPRNAAGKDIFLHMADVMGSVEGRNIEFAGPGLERLSLDNRCTLATMCAELSADFALFPADQVVLDYLVGRTDETFTPVAADANAQYDGTYTIDLSQIRPSVAKPGFVPHHTVAVSELPGPVAIDQAFVGSCANGKLSDLATAAAIMKGHQVKEGVRFIVTPASQDIYLQALRAGYIETLVASGAVVTNSTCGACFGGHMGVLGPGETCITSSTRNFRGRMGSQDAEIYIGSSATVAASAIEGRIADPTPYL